MGFFHLPSPHPHLTPQHSAHLLEDPLLVLHGAQDQGAGHHVHGAIGHLVHVLPGGHHKALELQVSILSNALDQELLKVGVGVNTGHPASRRIELEVGSRATAHLQQGELPGGARKVPQVAEELVLLAHRLFVVGHTEPHQEVGEPFFADPAPQAQKAQQVRGTYQDADGQKERTASGQEIEPRTTGMGEWERGEGGEATMGSIDAVGLLGAQSHQMRNMLREVTSWIPVSLGSNQ